MDSSRQGPGKPVGPPGPQKQTKPPLKPLIIVPPYEPKKRGGTYLFILILLLVIAGAFYYYKRADTNTASSDPAEIQIDNIKVEDGVSFTIEEGGLPESASSVANEAGNSAYAAAAHAYKEGDYARAVGLLKDALREEPDSDDIKSALAKSLNRLALNKYNAGDLHGAKELLTEASEVSSDDAILENLANVHIKLKEYRVAASYLERVSTPKSDRTLFNLYTQIGMDSYHSGDVKTAREYFEKALAINPNDSQVKAVLVQLRKEHSVEDKMDSSDNRHFLVKFEGGENAVAGHLIGLLLEEAYEKVGSDLNFYPEDRIEALLYSKENFRDITRSPSWAGAVFDGRIKVPAGGVTEKTELLEQVIFHEYTHAVVRRLSGGRAPVWLNEGIAQYEEGRTSSQYSDILRELAATKKVSLRRLEGSFMGLSPQGAQVAYLLSLSSTEYIIREFGIFTVRKILENQGAGMSLNEAISSATYLSYEDLEKSWLESLR